MNDYEHFFNSKNALAIVILLVEVNFELIEFR